MWNRSSVFLILISLSCFGWIWLMDDSRGGVSVAAENPTAGQAQGRIPDEAIRLRILANSDSVQDQALKRKVRDAVLAEMGTWAKKPDNISEARAMVRSRLPLFQDIAQETVQRHGYPYDVQVGFGKVPFPTKLYGDRVHPAGEYETLLITIGEGKGDNWWCVLFPPLCFVDMSNGDAVSAREGDTVAANTVAANRALAAPREEDTASEQPKVVEVRWFFLDSLEDFFSGLFR